jgi:soluble lytic murein transglycosylase-like protein
MNATDRDSIIAAIRRHADSRGIAPSLLLALVEQESDFYPWATRSESGFHSKYVIPLAANGAIPFTELFQRSISWGLGQVMGQTARESGYTGPIGQLLEVETNLHVTCNVFEARLRAVGGDPRLALLRYNGGGRPAYADEVLHRMERWA